MKLRIAAALMACAALPAAAQEAPTKVFYAFEKDWNYRPMDKALQEAVSSPDLALQTAIRPDVVVLTTQDFEWTNHSERKTFSFTLVFTRDGDKLGESQESCITAKLADCSAQITGDIKTAAAIGR